MNMIGREREKDIILKCLESKRPEFLVVYGRRRVGKALFKKPANHVKIIETIAGQKRGLQRTDLAEKSGVADGEGLTKALRELEQCGFIRQYKNITTSQKGCFYQVIDPFVLSCLYFRNGKIKSWQQSMGALLA